MSFMRLPIFIGSPRKPIAKLGQTVIRRLALYGFDGFWRFRRKGQRDGAGLGTFAGDKDHELAWCTISLCQPQDRWTHGMESSFGAWTSQPGGSLCLTRFNGHLLVNAEPGAIPQQIQGTCVHCHSPGQHRLLRTPSERAQRSIRSNFGLTLRKHKRELAFYGS